MTDDPTKSGSTADGPLSSRERPPTSSRGKAGRSDLAESPGNPEDLLRRIQSVAEIGCWEYWAGTDTVRATDQLYRILEMPEGMEFTLETGLDFYVPEARRKVRAAVQSCVKDGIPFDLEVPIVTAEGTRKWVRVKGKRSGDEPGEERVTGVLQDISDRKQVEERLRTEEKVMRRMHKITAEQTDSFEEKIEKLIDLGREYLSLSYGFLTQIEGDTQRIVQSAGTHPLLQPGASCPLSRSYCRKTLETDNLLAVRDAPSDGWANDPAYETFGLGTYIGSKVIVEGEVFGTFCFAAHETREASFLDRERTFLEILTRWASYELERRQTTERLARQNDRLEDRNERLDRLAGVVSHDLRNPLNVAKGRLQLFRDEVAPGNEAVDPDGVHLQSVDQALERIDAIIRDMLTLTWSGGEAEETERLLLQNAASTCWEQVQTGEATLQFGADLPEDYAIEAYGGRLRQLLENLFRNAIDHGGEEVTVEVGRLPSGFYVEDSGTGIPAHQREKVFEASYTTSSDGTGLGLSIAKAVVEAHGWDISVANGELGGARFEITCGSGS